MGWVTSDGLHEGYVVPEFADGVRGSGTTGGGVPVDQVIVAMDYAGDPSRVAEAQPLTRPAAETIGWRVMCDCRDTEGRLLSQDRRWASELLVRVPSPALEDVDEGRLHAADEEVPYIADGAHEESLRGRWLREHVDGRDALSRVESTTAQIRRAERERDAAVADARSAGATWDAVGRAAGMARQSAQGRWGGR